MKDTVKVDQAIILIYFKIPLVGFRFEPSITIRKNAKVVKSGIKSFYVNTGIGQRRFKQTDIGKITEGAWQNSRVIPVTTEEDAKIAIETAKSTMKSQAEKMISNYKTLIAQHSNALAQEFPIREFANDEDDE